MQDHRQDPPQAPLQVVLLPVLRDNYLFVLHDGRQAAVVDPAVADPAIAWLKQRDLELVAVLQTHHHSDHIGGTPALLREWPRSEVVAALADRERIPFQTLGVAGGDRFTLLGQPVEVLAVPGHTRAHLAFHLPVQGELFCGDTLFAAGCGRLFEGSPEQMHHSLGLLAALPETTRVWCAHEYTASNLRWAAAERPGDGAIAERLQTVLLARAQDRPTIPSSIGEERRTNLFLRAADGQELAALRRSKNEWTD
ncbi:MULTISPECIES: hydroxyacylglutathione hydrolase [unclassified Cyanobium]|uniref:hydroxyacylglutathione hydrolase n=1 Tax=unclassified Cyanobium TaxID=2627006 RepID=UPI0020CCDEDC|nr:MULTISPECIES: hydroxyacylglutathione hydrolase [unclassified Cyanobium]MCP9832983.1 hydroxyacylglutathione hydrolase [Cyanobium sp. La Preciosa 7G6]MCP9935733.1 hydroxyacylglutathione hydrolase [Cyanobium sp. Aljojuca 7A6]